MAGSRKIKEMNENANAGVNGRHYQLIWCGGLIIVAEQYGWKRLKGLETKKKKQ